MTITATTAPQFDGVWTGTTGQARAFSFTVEGGKISKVSVSFSAIGCGVTGESKTTYTPPIALQGSAIAFTSGADLIRSWTGTFTSATQASAASAADGGPRYGFVFVDQEGFEQHRPQSFAGLLSSFREYQ